MTNGAQGLLIHIPGATVMTYELNFRAGEYLVTRAKWETPHLMEHLLLGANKKWPKARAFQAEFEKNGAYCNASTGSYDIIYEAECADFEWRRILELLTLAISQPLFLSDEFAAEYGNVKEELTAHSNNHFRHLSLSLRAKYGFHAVTDKQRLELMQNVSIEDIVHHYSKTHTTSNLRFVIAGRLPQKRQTAIEKLLNNLDLPDGGGRIVLPTELPKRLGRPLVIPNKTIENLYFYADTFALKRLGDQELDALSLINSMLTETLYSRILGTAREQGLVYSMSSNLAQTKDSTNWWFGAQVRPDNAPALFKIITREMQKVIRGDLTAKDIASAKRYAIGRYQRGAQTVGGTASGYAQRYFFDGAIEDYYKIPRRIRAVNKEAIIKSTKVMFKDNVWGWGVLGSHSPKLIGKLNNELKKLWTT